MKKKKPFCAACNIHSGLRAKCHGCGKYFCFDHIYGGQLIDGMSENDRIVDACEDCRKRYGYFTVGTRRLKKL